MDTTKLIFYILLPAIEAVIIGYLAGALHLAKARAKRAEDEVADMLFNARTSKFTPRFTPPTKEQMDEYRRRYPDYSATRDFPQPPPSVTAKYQQKD